MRFLDNEVKFCTFMSSDRTKNSIYRICKAKAIEIYSIQRNTIESVEAKKQSKEKQEKTSLKT